MSENFLRKLKEVSAVKDGTSRMWCRIVMDKEVHKLVAGLDYENFDALEISGDKWKALKCKSYKSVVYPDFDICEDKLDEKFDFIIAEQVFEHLTHPYQAAKNVYDMLQKNGYFLLTTPFMLWYHPEPNDCTRWTETGLKYFLSECGFGIENIKTGSWGNRECVIANFDSWAIFDESNHSLENDPRFPVSVWALARK